MWKGEIEDVEEHPRNIICVVRRVNLVAAVAAKLFFAQIYCTEFLQFLNDTQSIWDFLLFICDKYDVILSFRFSDIRLVILKSLSSVRSSRSLEFF